MSTGNPITQVGLFLHLLSPMLILELGRRDLFVSALDSQFRLCQKGAGATPWSTRTIYLVPTNCSPPPHKKQQKQ